jgi:hypothetical protein
VTTLGIIVDSTRPYKTLNSRDYIIRLRIIDEHLNESCVISSPNKFVTVFLFIKELDFDS